MDVGDVQLMQSHIKDEVGLRCQKLFQDFLEEFKEVGELKYVKLVKNLESPDRSLLEVNFVDVERYNQNLATTVIEEYYRIYPYLNKAVVNFVKDHLGLEKEKEAYVSFTDVSTRHKIRNLSTSKIGTLLCISGQVVRTHPVHPELVLGTFICLDCQTEIRGVEQQFKYTQPTICRNSVCSNRRRFMLDVEKSYFVDFQKIRVQETQSELPRGCIPRSVEIILRSEIVETVQAGDRYDFTGTLIVVPDVGSIKLPGTKVEYSSQRKFGDGQSEGLRGLKALGVRDLKYKTAFLACSVQMTTTRFSGTDLPLNEVTAEDMKKQMTDAEWNKVYEMSKDKALYQNLIQSLFPSIYGSDEIKKGILLQLFSGVAKTTHEKTSLRGDINICIVGDPSTAKSQFLKQVADFSPRAIYTSGKSSSAAGLTAAVVRDEESFDFVIEAGALMLADNGICCIDEFDKMDLRNQVTIHEAMEQQTISIAKAGVRASLNARTSILAAANPINGRYDRSKSLQKNIQMSAPIMSRFDLFFILVDECNEIVDYAVARKIVDLHSNIESSINVYTRSECLRYITFARQFKPIIGEEAAKLLIENYGNLRQRDTCVGSKSTWRITVRQLESMIRLSEAMAKMECSNEVTAKHVKEAYRLLNKSIIRVEQPDIHLDEDNEFDDDDMINENGLDENATEINGHEVNNELEKKKLILSFEDYKNISNMLIIHMRHEEHKSEFEGDDNGMKRSEIINWYLEQVENQIESEEELIERKALIEKIIDRLIYHDQIIIPLRSTKLKSQKKSDEESELESDPLLVVHPNYVIE